MPACIAVYAPIRLEYGDCPILRVISLLNPVKAVVAAYSTLSSCPTSNGTATAWWSCGIPNDGCCDDRIIHVNGKAPRLSPFLPFGELFVPNTTSPLPSTLGSTPPTSATSPSQESSPENKFMAIGTGVGVPSGDLLLAILGSLFSQKKKKKFTGSQVKLL